MVFRLSVAYLQLTVLLTSMSGKVYWCVHPWPTLEIYYHFDATSFVYVLLYEAGVHFTWNNSVLLAYSRHTVVWHRELCCTSFTHITLRRLDYWQTISFWAERTLLLLFFFFFFYSSSSSSSSSFLLLLLQFLLLLMISMMQEWYDIHQHTLPSKTFHINDWRTFISRAVELTHCGINADLKK